MTHFLSNHVVLVIILVCLLVMFVLPGKRSHGSPLMPLYGCLTVVVVLVFALVAASAVGHYLQSQFTPGKVMDWLLDKLPSWLAAFFKGAIETSQATNEKYLQCLRDAIIDLDLKALEKQWCDKKQAAEWETCVVQSVFPNHSLGLTAWNQCRQKELVLGTPPTLFDKVKQNIVCPWLPAGWLGCPASP